MSTFHVRIDAASTTALFEQVRTQIATAVASGRLSAGTRLPTVRSLATELAVAPHTVARAYRELEADSVIATHGRSGTFVRSEILEETTTPTSTSEVARAAAAAYVHTVRRLGLSSPEAARLVEKAWHEG